MRIIFGLPFSFLLVVFFSLHTSAQTFQKTYGGAGEDQAQYVLETLNGYLVAGSATPLGSSQPDAYLFEIDKKGELLWQQSYGGSQKDIFMAVIPANDGGFVAIGETWSFGQGQQDLFVVKVDPGGQVVWCKTFGGSINDYARSIMPVSDGYILSGPQYSVGAGGLDAYFIRLDNQGNVKYSKTVGSSLDDQIQAVYLKDNVLYAGGGVSGNGSFLTLDAQTCSVLSITSYGGSGTEALYRCLPTPDGNFVLADHTWSTTGGTELRQWAMKVRPNGTTIWSKVYGFPGSNFRGGVENVPGGGFVLAPWDFANPSSTDGMLVRINANGDVMWANRYGGNAADRFFKTIPTNDGGFISVGHTRSFGAGGDDIFVVKTDAAGLVASCCPKSFTIESQNFNSPVSSPTLAVNDFASAQNWSIQSKDIAPFIFEQCSTTLPKGVRQIKLCPHETFTVNGKPYTAPAVAFDTIPSLLGCDSVIEYRLLPNTLPTTSRSASICLGSSVTIYGSTYDQPGIYLDTIPSTSGGCDTALTLTIFVKSLIPAEKSASICPGGSVTLYGSTYTQPGIYTKTVPASAGCDTALTLTILVKSLIPSEKSATICPGGSVTLYGTTYTQPGIYTKTVPANTGCDTALTLTVLVKSLIPAERSASICPGGSVTLYGTTYTQPGIYTKTVPASTGCDTALTLTILVKSLIPAERSASICPGGSVTLYGTTYTQPGIYTKTVPANTGCDTALTLTILVQSLIPAEKSASICPGGSVTLYGTTYTQPGIYTKTVPASAGCDTALTLTILVKSLIPAEKSASICPGGSVTLYGTTYTQPGIYTKTVPANTGCDTALILTVLVQSLVPAARSATLCPGTSATFGGVTYTQAGVFLDTLAASVGCDTALVVTIVAQPLTTLSQSATICPGASVTFAGTTYTQPGTYLDTIPASTGCDTVLTVTILQNSDTLFVPEKHHICAGDTLTAYGSALTEAGTYFFQEPSLAACVLMHEVELEVTEPPIFVVGIAPSGCDGKPIGSIQVNGPQAGWQARLDGGNWTNAATVFEKLPPARYVVSVRDAQGCESRDTVQVPETPTFLLKIRLDTTLAECGLLTATASHSSQFPVQYQWSPAAGLDCPTCPTVTLRPEVGQVYQLLAVDSAGCRATVEVAASGGEVYHIYAPNVFSPNDDGENDRFTLYGSRCARLIRRFGIYDRWGGLVFYRENLPLGEEAEGWDGYARSQLVVPGVFAWWAEVELRSGGLVKLKGSVTVVR